MRSNLQQEQISASKSLCSWLRTACIAALLFFFVLESYFLIFELPRIVTVSIQSACNEQGFCAVTQEHPHGELVFTPPIQKPHADSINEISVLIPKPHSEPTQDIAVIIPKPHSEPVPIIHHPVSLMQRIQDCFQVLTQECNAPTDYTTQKINGDEWEKLYQQLHEKLQ